MNVLRVPSPLRQSILAQCLCTSYFTRGVVTATATKTTTQNGPSPPRPPPAKPSTSLDLSITLATVHSYTISVPPNAQQLQYAASFFHKGEPQVLFSAAFFRSFPPSPFPEVAFLGRSNVGKSSLLNALFGRTKVKVAYVSKKAGRTRTMNGFGVTGGLPLSSAAGRGKNEALWKQFPHGGLIVVDMPGYGSGSREIWGQEALKYLEQRKQLRRTFVLIDAQIGLKSSDITLLTHLRRKGISHQIILSKVDKTLHDGTKASSGLKLQQRLRELQELSSTIRDKLDVEAEDGRRGVGDIIYCSAEKTFEGTGYRKIGVDEIRWAVLSACGMESDASGKRRRQTLENITVLDEEG